MLLAARKAGIPLIVGSAATGGTNTTLATVVELTEDIARQHDLHFKLAVIQCEPPREQLIKLFRDGKVKPLYNAPDIDEDLFERSAHIVGVAGVEPFQQALEQGADVIIAGRSADVSIFAALPLMRGCEPGPVYGAAKIMECGAAPVKIRKHADPLFAWIRDDHFVVEPPNADYHCTPISVASHNLYEAASPYELYQPAGVLHSEDATYEAISDRAVKVGGNRFERADQYTIKLEGAELVGYQSLFFGAIHDPLLLGQLDSWQSNMEASVRRRISDVWGEEIWERAHLHIRRYGMDAAMGAYEPAKAPGHEIGLVVELTAPTQEEATALAKSASHICIHAPIPEWSGLITTMALPYSPYHLNRGAVYRWNLHHVVEVDDPMELFELELRDI
jgi:hypothetical protein